MTNYEFPKRAKSGLYDPSYEHDACGVAFVVDLNNIAKHEIVEQGLTALRNLDHRGATGADEAAGDGAGILIQVPDKFFRAQVNFNLPPSGSYAVGLAYLPTDKKIRKLAKAQIELIAEEEDLDILGWRKVSVNTESLSPISLSAMPHFEQLFIAGRSNEIGIKLDRLAFILRRRAQNEAQVYFASLSARTLVYKGMLTTSQLEEVFPELHDEKIVSALALVHSRFSTNTFPSWELAHPFRLIAHNGEINTVRGNRNWMRARETLLASNLIPGNLERLFPICTPGGSDSASFDEVLELLHLSGRSLPHSILMMIPEAWENNVGMNQELRDFYAFHSSLMEPWDGPACVAFTDGTLIGGVLDRNGLRPARYWVNDEGLVVFASESGVIPMPAAHVVQKGRLQPGRMFLVDLEKHRIVNDEEIKNELAKTKPYKKWLKNLIDLDKLPQRQHIVHSHSSVIRRQQLFGYSHEDLKILIAPMANTGKEPIGSMGNDVPLAVLSDRPRMIFDYFNELFAQVTNPPLDAIREELVTAVRATIGPENNLLKPTSFSCRQVVINFPVLDSEQLAKIVHLNKEGDLPGLNTHVLRGLYPVVGGAVALEKRIAELCREASKAIRDGARVLVVSDRHSTGEMAPIPSLLLTSAVHHHLVTEKTRTKVGLIVEAGDVREVHHIALLIGYGAAAVNPYLAFESAEDLARRELYVDIDPETAVKNVSKALGKGVLKVMSKMGVSTIASYTGAQIFEAIGLSSELIDKYFTGTTSSIEGIGIAELAEEIRLRHERAYPSNGIQLPHRTLPEGGQYQWRKEGEAHLFNPDTVFRLQQAVRLNSYEQFKIYSSLVNDNSTQLMTLRGLFEFKSSRKPIPIEQVEPASEIMKRFATGAMSYGSISIEAHENLAIAMNEISGKSNTGEGGEDPQRLYDLKRRSAIKQVASGRFGVTSEYLCNADDIQIKMAQGAKPGEGGQLPGAKVYPWVAKTRHSTTGVGLISPPPHHDIYSIEDIKQLIHDLKCANPKARIHVKLVAEVGVGTVAAGVAKAKADVVLISGHDGGTGAAPLTSVKHAGGPWELGLAETQQTLLLNGLRDRIVVQCDGQLKTGRDVVIAALLGAEEFGFATAPLVASGCIMMRVCHKDVCPVGIATQNPQLREKFAGKPEHVINFFRFIAQEVREILAELGFSTIEEAVGHYEAINVLPATDHWKASGLDLSPILHQIDIKHSSRHHTVDQDHGLDKKLDRQLIKLAQPAIKNGESVYQTVNIRNVDRTVGTLLGHEVTLATKGKGLPDNTIKFKLYGTAGQSFGAFLPKGITLNLIGDANDYVGKGLSGGRIIVAPDPVSQFDPAEQIVAGNVIAYGATSGQIYLRGIVGERFCVRNSGASVVAEGVGDHGCEYMTGGKALILGATGRNFGAGMSGGIAWVLNFDIDRLNNELVDVVPLKEEDIIQIRELLINHAQLTGSSIAKTLLDTQTDLKQVFTKIEPRDYARVIKAKKFAVKRGLSETESTKLMMEAAHG